MVKGYPGMGKMAKFKMAPAHANPYVRYFPSFALWWHFKWLAKWRWHKTTEQTNNNRFIGKLFLSDGYLIRCMVHDEQSETYMLWNNFITVFTQSSHNRGHYAWSCSLNAAGAEAFIITTTFFKLSSFCI